MPYQLFQTLHGHKSAVSAISQCGETTEILSASNDFSAKSWKFKPGLGYQVVSDFEGHHDSITCASFIPSSEQFPSGLCVSGGYDRKIIIFTPFDRKIVQVLCFESTVTSLYVIDNVLFLAGFENGMVMLFKLSYRGEKVEFETIQNYCGHTSPVWSVIYTAGFVITASEDNNILVFEKSEDENNKIVFPVNELKEHPEGVQALVAMNNVGQFLSAGNDGIIRRWSASTGACLQSIMLHQSLILAIAVSPDNSFFTSCGEDEVYICYNAFSDDLIEGEIIEYSPGACSVTILPNKNIVIGSSEGEMHIFTPKQDKKSVTDAASGPQEDTEDSNQSVNLDQNFDLNENNSVISDVIESDDELPDFDAYFPQRDFIVCGDASEYEMKTTLNMINPNSIGYNCSLTRSHIRRLINPLNKPSPRGVKALLRILCNSPLDRAGNAFLNLSVCYGEHFERNPSVMEAIDYYKETCEALLPFLSNEDALYNAVIALGSFVVYGGNRTLNESTLDFLFIHLSGVREKLLAACHSLLSHVYGN